MKNYDVIIVGAGPGGSSCATLLGKQNKKVLLLDKAKFPREKICGDGVFKKGFPVLKKMGINDFNEMPHCQIDGVFMTALSKKSVARSATLKYTKEPSLANICKRYYFDNMLINTAKKYCEVKESFNVTGLIWENDAVKGVKGLDENGKECEYFGRIVVGADGGNSFIAKELKAYHFDDDHYAVAMRAYYSGVEGITNKIEIHYLKDLIPGYFWIFPTGGENNEANVGLGMRCTELKKNKMNLKNFLLEVIEKNSYLKKRFGNAKLESKAIGAPLALGPTQIPIAFDRAILIGEAAQLVDPLTGEGIGNALVSADIAAETILEALDKNDFSKSFLMNYERKVHDTLTPELQKSERYRQMLKNPFLIKNLITSIKCSKSIQKWFLDKIFP